MKIIRRKGKEDAFFYLLIMSHVHIQVAETDQLTYVGTNYDEDSSRANVCKSVCRYNQMHADILQGLLHSAPPLRYYVGALNRDSGSLTLHRAELMSLKPYIPGNTSEIFGISRWPSTV